MAKKKSQVKKVPPREKLPKLNAKEEGHALQLGRLAKFARKAASPPKFCVNCSQGLTADNAVASVDPEAKFCPVHGVQLRPDGTCPLED